VSEAGPAKKGVKGKAVAAWDRGNSIAQKGVDWVEAQPAHSRKGAAIGVARRYKAAEGSVYVMLLSAYSLLTFIPALVAISTYTTSNSSGLSNELINRLHLKGDTASLVTSVVGGASTKQLGATLIALANLALFGLGFGRALQLAHARAWGIELKLSLLYDELRYIVALLAMTGSLLGLAFLAADLKGTVWFWGVLPLVFLGLVALFTLMPWMLLHGEVSLRHLVPGAVVVALGLLGMRVLSHFLFVNWLNWYGKYYGAFGIVMAIFFWITIAATIIVVAAALSPPLAARRDAIRAQRAQATG
jgi:membrane protein